MVWTDIWSVLSILQRLIDLIIDGNLSTTWNTLTGSISLITKPNYWMDQKPYPGGAPGQTVCSANRFLGVNQFLKPKYQLVIMLKIKAWLGDG